MARLSRVITPCVFEPVSVTEFQSHARIDTDDDYTLAAGYIAAARAYLELITWRAFMPAVYEMYLGAWPTAIQLEAAPVISLDSIKYTPEGGSVTTLSSSVYVADLTLEPARAWPKSGQSWPVGTLEPYVPIAVRYTAGYGTAALAITSTAVEVAAARAAIPPEIRLALCMLAAHWYENREAVIAGGGVSVAVTLPMAVDSLISNHRLFTW